MSDLLIEEYIPAGYENRVTRTHLHSILHIDDRVIREEIKAALERGVFIASYDDGYFRWKDAKDDPYFEGYMGRENSRFLKIGHRNRLMRDAWLEIHPEKKRKKKDQIPGQMSLFKR